MECAFQAQKKIAEGMASWEDSETDWNAGNMGEEEGNGKVSVWLHEVCVPS